MLIVRFWDGSKANATDRKDAVRIAEKGLSGWMQKGDRIAWQRSSIAFVVNELCEGTDAWAKIIGE